MSYNPMAYWAGEQVQEDVRLDEELSEHDASMQDGIKHENCMLCGTRDLYRCYKCADLTIYDPRKEGLGQKLVCGYCLTGHSRD